MSNKYAFDYSLQPGRERTRFYAPDPKDALVSVITPFYNAGKYFEQTFYSVMNQTFPWFEWVIVNDGSTRQEDVELLHRLAAQDPRVRVVTQENGGLSCARNTGIANTRTDLVVPLDADDLIAPTYLECLYWSMKYHPEAAWSYTSTYGFHDLEYIWKYPFDAEKLKTYNFLNYTGMIRKADIQQIGGYKVEKWSYYEDWRFWLEMLAKDKIPVHIASCLFWYRRLGSGMLSTINQDQERVAFCQRIIEEAASKANGQVKAVEYPLPATEHPYEHPEFEKWDRRADADREGTGVLWLTSWMKMGGADKFNLDAIAGLKEQGFRNFVLTTEASDNEWWQKFEKYTDEIFALPDFLDSAHYLEFISYFIQSRNVDVLMLTNSYAGYYMVPWLRKHFPNLVIVDYVHMEEWSWRGGGYAYTSGNLARLTDKTYVCNSATKEVMTDRFGRDPESVECMYIGVDHQEFAAEKEQPGYLHELLQLPEERPIVLFPCRIHPQKRPFLMLQIASRISAEIPEAAFVVVGEGEQLDSLQEEIVYLKLQNNVFCIGATDHMRACYRDSAVTLICSLKEGLALTAYESLSMGVPVISSDVGGQRDLIDDSVGTLLPLLQNEHTDMDCRNFPEEEIEQYTQALLKILRDPELQARLGANGRARIEHGFTQQQMHSNLSRALKELCEDRSFEENRKAAAEALAAMPGLTEDYYLSYLRLAETEQRALEIWNAKLVADERHANMVREYERVLADYEELRKNSNAVWETKCWLDQELEKKKQECDELLSCRYWFRRYVPYRIRKVLKKLLRR